LASGADNVMRPLRHGPVPLPCEVRTQVTTTSSALQHRSRFGHHDRPENQEANDGRSEEEDIEVEDT
jgi:hypothetical protein